MGPINSNYLTLARIQEPSTKTSTYKPFKNFKQDLEHLYTFRAMISRACTDLGKISHPNNFFSRYEHD